MRVIGLIGLVHAKDYLVSGWKLRELSGKMPNQLNADEAANDEPKTYNNEAEGEECERGWQDAELDNLKGDLVDEDDGDPRRHSYQDKVTSQAHADTNRRNKDDIGRDLPSDAGPGRPNFPYQQDLGAIVSGLNRPFFPNVSQVPYHAYVPYPSMLFGHSASSDIDGKNGLPRHPPPDVPPSMYSLPGQLGQIPNPLAPPWSPGGPLYPMCTASAMANVLRYPYPFSISSSGTLNNVSPFPLIPPHPHTNGMHPTVIPHHGLPLPGQIPNGHGAVKPLSDKKNMNTDTVPSKRRERDERPSKPYVKKPLNAFMLYMKEQRAKVVAECTLKESAAINQILGRKWHSLNRDEQQKYYEMARKERQMHMQMFPGWSARDNYGKRKKRKKEKAQDCTAQNPKKCRAVFGLEQQQLWCAPCRRKKKCVRYQQDGDDSDYEDSDASPHAPYHGSPNPPCAPIQPDQPNPAGSGQRTSLSSSGCANSSTSSSSGIQGSSSLTDRLSPSPVAVVDQVKQERSSPASCQPTQTNPNTRNGMFIPPTNSYTPEAAEGAFSYSLSETSCGKSSRSNATNNQPSKSFAATSRHPPNVQTAGGKTPNDPGRNKRSNSHSDSPMYVGQNMFASSILSPASMGLNSPHGDRILSQLPAAYLQMSHLAAAANLPASPLNGLMGFHGFKGLSSPVGSALSGSGPSVAPGGHATSTGSRRTASALEGKS